MLVGGAQDAAAISGLNSSLTGALSQSRAVLVTEDLQVVQGRVAATEQLATL